MNAGLPDRVRSAAAPAVYAALDLGSNNCRLLIARPSGAHFRVVDSFSRIVRLSEGLTASGRLQPAAMERTLDALEVCAEKLRARGVTRLRAVATQACRQAANGAAFLAEVERRCGLRLEVITPEEEARLAVEGCLDLLERTADAALVLDVGGASTELSWLDLGGGQSGSRPPTRAWASLPLGVVTLAERWPEPPTGKEAWFTAMVADVRAALGPEGAESGLADAFAAGRGQVIGTSGAVTSLAGLHLGLTRYRRDLVDGASIERADIDTVIRRLMTLDLPARHAEPCIGPGRADLILSGAAILIAVLDAWPADRVRVADRGLREGLLLDLMARDRSADALRAA